MTELNECPKLMMMFVINEKFWVFYEHVENKLMVWNQTGLWAGKSLQQRRNIINN